MLGKEQEGIVIEVQGGAAKVKTTRHNDCENCGACPGNSAIVISANNALGAKLGQRVAIEVKEVNILKSAFIVYILPLIAIFVGALAGDSLYGDLGISAMAARIAGGILAFILSVWYIKYVDNKARADKKAEPVITRIIA
ncbi:SoxR reducing system RseC family protein [Sporomusa sphaeroides]|uniref:SoxR reducing system RseC family protein n=1 Tax=Sporomusa sphaeroides TaxID=47679 RepID=UPI002D16DC6E|nr:SoxR reducing system RseC family protein [Sporomusa sphaeroides]HML35153.1 SoxR reducing system RseC family protein [Sporomusa sphaeroides]